MSIARPAIARLVMALALGGAAAVAHGAPVDAGRVSPVAGSTRSAPVTIGDGPTRVLVVGDSVLEGAAGTIPAALPGREVLVDTEVSRSTARSADAAAAHGTDWDVVVVLLGHNDAGSPNAYQPPYRRVLDTFAGSPRIVAMTLHEVRPSYPAVNAFIRDEASRRPNVRVLDWNAVAAADPGATAGDGLHLSPSGSDRVAREIAAQVVEAEVAFAPTTTTTTTAPTTTTATTTTAATSTSTPRATTTGPPPATTTTPVVTTMSLVAVVGGPPPTPGPHTPRWAWPGVIAGTAVLGLVLGREHRRRAAAADPSGPEVVTDG